MKPDRWFLAISTLVCLALLWFIGGAWRAGGLHVFLGGALALAGCMTATRYGWRRPLFAVYLTVAMAAFVVGVLELYLRLIPSALSPALGNVAYGRYHTGRGGMYMADQHLGVVLKPSFSCNAYWQGHWWRHTTNAAGYRGPLADQADAVFLGDSMIYGHGVDDDQTVSAHFGALSPVAPRKDALSRSERRLTVANLGQQGTSAIEMAIRLRRVGIGLRPKVVYLCCHFNDVADANLVYDADELRRYVAVDPAADYEPMARRSFWARKGGRTARRVWNENIAPSLCLSGAIVGLQHAVQDGSLTVHRARAARSGPWVPNPRICEMPFEPWSSSATEGDQLGWQANVQAFAQIDAVCKRHGARFVLFDLGYPHAFSQAIEDHAKRMGIAYSPAGRVVLARALAGEEVYLANDGHWTPLGNQIIAAELARAAVVQ